MAPEHRNISICREEVKVKRSGAAEKKCWKVKRKQVCFSIKNELYTKYEKLYRGHVVGHKFAKPNWLYGHRALSSLCLGPLLERGGRDTQSCPATGARACLRYCCFQLWFRFEFRQMAGGSRGSVQRQVQRLAHVYWWCWCWCWCCLMHAPSHASPEAINHIKMLWPFASAASALKFTTY